MFTSHVLKDIFKRVVDDRCPQIAASLAYATLLALIPLTVLIFKVYSAALVTPDLQLNAQTFIFDNLSPAMAKDVQQYLLEGAAQANSLNFLGFFMLLVSVVVMVFTIDSALNSIWKINTPRYLVRRVLVYLAVLIFGPLAISFSLFVSTYIASMPLIGRVIGESIDSGLFSWLPFIILLAAFTGLYKWVPDCEVKWINAISGATIAVCLFEVAKAGFILYVSYFPSYEILYGALAAIPLLLIWIYLTWLIVLIGAEITYFMEK